MPSSMIGLGVLLCTLSLLSSCGSHKRLHLEQQAQWQSQQERHSEAGRAQTTTQEDTLEEEWLQIEAYEEELPPQTDRPMRRRLGINRRLSHRTRFQTHDLHQSSADTIATRSRQRQAKQEQRAISHSYGRGYSLLSLSLLLVLALVVLRYIRRR